VSTLRDRLVKCFLLVFPDLAEHEVPQATVDSVPAWDSLASVNLIAILEEEFDIEILDEELAGMLSFERILDVLGAKLGGR